ncbi:MAG TPA: hypothetical protein DCR14_10670, partial [Acidimicrobiaceae bacterium]|nr:hypothetical protein [Acidimicrobiaceae bacterium]
RAFVQRLDIVLQAVADLADGLADGAPLDGEHFSTSKWLAAKARKGELALIVHTLRAHVALAYGRWGDAAAAVNDAAPMARMAPGEAIVGIHQFQLAMLDALGEMKGGRRARRAQRLLRRAAEANPHDMAHRQLLADGRAGAEAASELAQRHHQLADLAVARRLIGDTEGARSALRAWGALGAARTVSNGT